MGFVQIGNCQPRVGVCFPKKKKKNTGILCSSFQLSPKTSNQNWLLFCFLTL